MDFVIDHASVYDISLVDEDQPASPTTHTRLIWMFAAGLGRHRAVGVGESTFPGQLCAAPDLMSEALETATKRLVGTRIGWSSDGTWDDFLLGKMASLSRSVLELPTDIVAPQATFGLDRALLDLVDGICRSQGIAAKPNLGQFANGLQVGVNVRQRKSSSLLVNRIHALRNEFDFARVIAPVSLHELCTIIERFYREWSKHQQISLWVDCQGRYSGADFSLLLEAIALYPPRLWESIILEQPMHRRSDAEFDNIVRQYQEANDGLIQGLTLVAHDSCAAFDTTDPDTLPPSSFSVCVLDPAFFGSTYEVSTFCKMAGEHRQINSFALQIPPFTTDIGVAQALQLCSDFRSVSWLATSGSEPVKHRTSLAEPGAFTIRGGRLQPPLATGKNVGDCLSHEKLAATAWDYWSTSSTAARRRARQGKPRSGIASLSPNVFETFHVVGLGKAALDSCRLETEALARGFNTFRISPKLFFLLDDSGHPSKGVYGSALDDTSVIATYCTGFKDVTRKLLRDAGVPVSEGSEFSQANLAACQLYAEQLGYPVVVKPIKGTQGVGVTANIQNREDLLWALRQLGRATGQPFIVEKHLPGDDYRFFVYKGRTLSVLRREPGGVVGDGTSSVAELVIRKNGLRRLNPHLLTRPIRLGEMSRFAMDKHGLSLATVPPDGLRVLLTGAGNLSQGGDSVEVLHETHSSLLAAAEAAALAVPTLSQVGVDFLIEDHRLPAHSQRIGVCELNSLPGQSANDFPLYGPVIDVSGMMADDLASVRPGPSSRRPMSEISAQFEFKGIAGSDGIVDWLRSWLDQLCWQWEIVAEGRKSVLFCRGKAEFVGSIPSRIVAAPLSIAPVAVRTIQYRGAL